LTQLVSIIIPTNNRSHLLGETLESILTQTYQNWECLVIDDNSTDYTQELMGFYVESDSRISYFKRPKNRKKGANACRNYGLELSNGDYINWFDDDDLMHPEKLELQLKALENSDSNFTVCQAQVLDDKISSSLGLRNPRIISDTPFYDYLSMRIGWMTPSALWKKDFLIRNNFKFDEELQAAQEWEFHCRILNKFPEYTQIDDPLVLLRKHAHSITYNQNEKQRFWYYFHARLKIYRNSNLDLDPKSIQFLKDYLLNSYKKMIVAKNANVINAYKLFILPDKKMPSITKINALIAILSFKLFDRGNVFLQKIKYT
jgi:glycosyltransferase involved in cell wall biosynthesis